MSMCFAPAFLIFITLSAWPGQFPGFSHFKSFFTSIACLHFWTQITSAFILWAISFILSSSPPQAHTKSPIFSPCKSSNGLVTIIPPVVLAIGVSKSQALPVNGPPMIISP